MNEALRDAYIEDCQKGVERWNRILEKTGVSHRLSLPHKAFHREIGTYGSSFFTPEGEMISEEEWNAKKGGWLPSEEDRAYVNSLMMPVY